MRDISDNISSIYYKDKPMKNCKNSNILFGKKDIFNILAQNIDSGYMFESHQHGTSNEYPQSMFGQKKICLPL